MKRSAGNCDIIPGERNVSVYYLVQTTGSEIKQNAEGSTRWETTGKTKEHREKLLKRTLWEQKRRKLGAARGKQHRNQNINMYNKVHNCVQKLYTKPINLLKANKPVSFRT